MEPAALLEEGIVTKASDLDIAAVMGRGFPAYRFAFVFALTDRMIYSN